MKRPEHISLEAVQDEPVSFAFDLPFGLAALDREPLKDLSPVRLEGTIARIEGGYALEGRYAFRGKLECSRCLVPYAFAVDEPFTLTLLPRKAGAVGEAELSREDLDVNFYEGDELAVAPIAEERVQMALPMKPLCREDCLGLCPRCGADRNAGPCGCKVEEADPRWGALADWKNATRSQKV
ncbi:MAG TPA: DUF177 domain-containing protein [Thermoanaerobaculia bacterium]|jgi:uncharacterized protein